LQTRHFCINVFVPGPIFEKTAGNLAGIYCFTCVVLSCVVVTEVECILLALISSRKDQLQNILSFAALTASSIQLTKVLKSGKFR
jgi:hypothetical protein